MEALRVGPKVFGKSIPGVAVASPALDFGAQVAEGHTWQRATLSSGLSLALGFGAATAVVVGCGIAGVATLGVAAVACAVGIVAVGVGGSIGGGALDEFVAEKARFK